MLIKSFINLHGSLWILKGLSQHSATNFKGGIFRLKSSGWVNSPASGMCFLSRQSSAEAQGIWEKRAALSKPAWSKHQVMQISSFPGWGIAGILLGWSSTSNSCPVCRNQLSEQAAPVQTGTENEIFHGNELNLYLCGMGTVNTQTPHGFLHFAVPLCCGLNFCSQFPSWCSSWIYVFWSFIPSLIFAS